MATTTTTTTTTNCPLQFFCVLGNRQRMFLHTWIFSVTLQKNLQKIASPAAYPKKVETKDRQKILQSLTKMYHTFEMVAEAFSSTGLPLSSTRCVLSKFSSHSNQRLPSTSVSDNFFGECWDSNPGQLSLEVSMLTLVWSLCLEKISLSAIKGSKPKMSFL